MAFYLFLRFHIANEPWPDFSDMVRWQKIKLLRTRDDPTKKLSYHAQNLAIKNCFRDHNINLTSWTHLGRKAGCQLGEALDVPDAQIRRLGHWEGYISHGQTLFFWHCKAGGSNAAGHGSEAGNYYLSRESINPLESLR